MTKKTIAAFVDNPSERYTTGTVIPVGKFTEAASLPMSHSFSTINDKKTAIKNTNTMESPYSIKKNTQIALFSVVTPEQSKFIKPVDRAVLNMVPEGDPDLTTYLGELLRKKTRTAKQYLLVSDNRNPWQDWGYRNESSENSVNWMKKKNWTEKLT